MVTGGEDGRITVLTAGNLQPLTVIGMCSNLHTAAVGLPKH